MHGIASYPGAKRGWSEGGEKTVGMRLLCSKIYPLQCNLDYPDLDYPYPRLSGLAGGACFRIIRYLVCKNSMNIISVYIVTRYEYN